MNIKMTLGAAILSAGMVGYASGAEKGDRIPVPEGFGYKPAFEIYRGDGKPLGAVTDFDPKSMADVGAKKTWYVDIAKGNNDNNGLSQDQAFKSMWRALQEQGDKKIIVAGGRYDVQDGWNGVRSNDALALVAEGAPAIFTTHLSVDFSLVEGSTYKGTKSHDWAWGNVVDLTQPLETRVLRQAASMPIQQGEYFVDGVDLYVSTHDGRAVDDQILTLLASQKERRLVSGTTYIENVEFWGGYNAFASQIATGKTMTLNKVIGRYSHGGEGFSFLVAGHGILYECEGYNNFGDDFNWHELRGESGTAVEINTVSRYAGTNTDMDSVNASSVHDGMKIVRVNGDYRLAKNRIVADINLAQSWNIACVAQSSRHASKETPWWSQNWSMAHEVTAWFDTCVGSNEGSSTKRGWSSESTAHLYFHNTDYKSGDTQFAVEPREYHTHPE